MASGGKSMIGLSSYREQASWGVWHQAADLLPSNYADELRRAGGVPVLLPPGADAATSDAVAVMERIDGVVLSGGADIDPERYGQARLETTDVPRTDRDEWEIALVHAAMSVGRPILAVCRGLQVLNVALGGTIIQHLPDTVGHHDHRAEVGTFNRHEVRIAAGSELAQVYGAKADVPTHHHQAVDRLGQSLVATAWAADATIEAAAGEGALWIIGVQWHPEVDGGRNLFDAFVHACDLARRRGVS